GVLMNGANVPVPGWNCTITAAMPCPMITGSVMMLVAVPVTRPRLAASLTEPRCDGMVPVEPFNVATPPPVTVTGGRLPMLLVIDPDQLSGSASATPAPNPSATAVPSPNSFFMMPPRAPVDRPTDEPCRSARVEKPRAIHMQPRCRTPEAPVEFSKYPYLK